MFGGVHVAVVAHMDEAAQTLMPHGAKKQMQGHVNNEATRGAGTKGSARLHGSY